jgi:hypothetical protein
MSGTISSMSYVYDGRECVGFVLARGRKGPSASPDACVDALGAQS